MFTISQLRKLGFFTLPKNGGMGLKGFDDLNLVPTEIGLIVKDILRIVNSSIFQSNPETYIAAWEAQRGPTTELRLPDDVSYQFVRENIKVFTKN